MGERVGTDMATKYVEHAALRQKCGKHNVCKEVARASAWWESMDGGQYPYRIYANIEDHKISIPRTDPVVELVGKAQDRAIAESMKSKFRMVKGKWGYDINSINN